jgi:hypothetical protein
MKECLLSRMRHHFETTHARRHLAACRYHLPQRLPSARARGCERDLANHLWRQDFVPAWHAAEALGLACEPSALFWRELKLAAQQLGLSREAQACASREWHRQWTGAETGRGQAPGLSLQGERELLARPVQADEQVFFADVEGPAHGIGGLVLQHPKGHGVAQAGR